MNCSRYQYLDNDMGLCISCADICVSAKDKGTTRMCETQCPEFFEAHGIDGPTTQTVQVADNNSLAITGITVPILLAVFIIVAVIALKLGIPRKIKNRIRKCRDHTPVTESNAEDFEIEDNEDTFV
ncbi:hypothetical protein ScPMuIL_004207 [Solemya velum]